MQIYKPKKTNKNTYYFKQIEVEKIIYRYLFINIL